MLRYRTAPAWTAALCATTLTLVACAAETSPEVAAADHASLVTALDTDVGTTIEFFTLDDGDIAIRIAAPSEDLLPSVLVPGFEEMTAVEMYEALSDAPAPAELVAAQAQWNELRASAPVDVAPEDEITELPGDGDGLGTVAHAVSRAQFEAEVCNGIGTTAWRDACILNFEADNDRPEVLGGSNRSDRIWLYTNALSGEHIQEIQRKSGLNWRRVEFGDGTTAARIVIPGPILSVGVASTRRRNFRARATLLDDGDRLHAAVKWFRD